MMSPRFVVFLALSSIVAFGAVSAVPRVAYADDPAMRSARRHYDRGEKLFALGKFDEALDEYQKAFDAKPLPGFLFNIGQCYRNLGDYDQAIFSFKKFLKLDPETPKRDAVEKLLEELEDKKERGESKKLILKKQEEPPEQPPPATKKPIYKEWWFWTGVGAVAVLGGVGIYVEAKPSAPGTELGNITFGK